MTSPVGVDGSFNHYRKIINLQGKSVSFLLQGSQRGIIFVH